MRLLQCLERLWKLRLLLINCADVIVGHGHVRAGAALDLRKDCQGLVVYVERFRVLCLPFVEHIQILRD